MKANKSLKLKANEMCKLKLSIEMHWRPISFVVFCLGSNEIIYWNRNIWLADLLITRLSESNDRSYFVSNFDSLIRLVLFYDSRSL